MVAVKKKVCEKSKSKSKSSNSACCSGGCCRFDAGKVGKGKVSATPDAKKAVKAKVAAAPVSIVSERPVYNQKFKDRVLKDIERAKLTRHEIAEKHGCSYPTVNRWARENGF